MSDLIHINQMYPDRYARKPMFPDRLYGRCAGKLRPNWYDDENRNNAMGMCLKGLRPQTALRAIGVSNNQIISLYNKANGEAESIQNFIVSELERCFALFLVGIADVSFGVLSSDTSPAAERARQEKLREGEEFLKGNKGTGGDEDIIDIKMDIKRILKG